MLNDVDANKVGVSGTSDAEGDGYECVCRKPIILYPTNRTFGAPG
jgi:hypothetical protein